MELAVGKVVGKPGQGRWGQVHDFFPEEGEKRQKRGRLVAAVSVVVEEGSGQVQIVALGREVLSRLQEMYYGVTDSDLLLQLKTAISRTAEEFGGLQTAAAVFLEDKLYVAVSSGAGVWVSTREGKQGWLVKPEVPGQEFGIAAYTSNVNEGLVLVLGTHEFWSGVSERLLTAAVSRSESNFLESVEMIVSEVQAGEGESGGAGVMIKTQDSTKNIQNMEREEQQPQKTSQPAENTIREKWTGLAKKLAGRIYVRGGDGRDRRKKLLSAGLVFMGILTVLFAGGQIWNQKRQISGSEKEKVILQMQYDFDEAKAMAALNPARSRELLVQIKQELDSAGGDKKDTRLVSIEGEWQKVWDEAAGIINISPGEILDLGLVRDGMEGNRMVKSEDELLVLDSGSGRVASINSKTEAGKILAGGSELEGTVWVAAYPGKILVAGNEEVWEIDQGKTTSRIQDKETLGKAAGVQMWAGNVYLLVNEEDRLDIRRYQASGDGFSAGQEWLTEEAAENLPRGTGMAIDGSIWVAGETAIYKFTRGVREEFNLSGWDELPQKIDGLFTDENAQMLYVWEKGRGRVVAMTKEGVYTKQYKGDLLGRADDLVIDEEAGTGYILAEGKVWKFDL